MDPTCPDISKYTTNSFLKATMSCQLTCGFLSIIAILFTYRKVFSSILLDSTFKEHLICCYFIHLIQSFGVFLLQLLLLFQHLTQPPCLGTIASWLCYSLRYSMVFSVISLPLLNLTLAIIRFISFFGGVHLRRWQTTTRRVLYLITIAAFCAEFYWRLSGVIIPGGQVSYCIANQKSIAEKSNAESLTIAIFEVITIFSGFLLMKLYKRENRLKRSYSISVNLTRRQQMLTMQLFLPYSVFHAIAFLVMAVFGYAYREVFSYLEEPWYSAGSGFTYFPMYFTMISPWIIYWIVVKSEKNRITKTNKLISLELRARTVYFENYRSQWEYQPMAREKKNLQGFSFWRWKRRSSKIIEMQ